MNQHHPLAERCRPESENEVLGQNSFWAPGKVLYELAQKDAYHSLIFWGPPGVGKTSLARLLAKKSGRKLCFLSAVSSGVKDIREVIDASQESLQRGELSYLVFLDEIHRLSKNQQDVLLPSLEQGIIKFIGATSENPSFEVNRAILSRSLCFRFELLDEDSLVALVHKSFSMLFEDYLKSSKLPDYLRGLKISSDAAKIIACSAGGDARKAINLTEAVVHACIGKKIADHSSRVEITSEDLENFSGLIASRYDKKGSDHYDIISAFIKSVRASHPDAALHYLARMLDSGEDPMFVARRLVILASEDIGNANPNGIVVANAVAQGVHLVGMPEARILLSQATTYLASSPKSNRAYLAIDAAIADVKKNSSTEVPDHLRNAVTDFNKSVGIGKDYAYAHHKREEARKQFYLPKEFRGKKYYIPSDEGTEKHLKEVLEKLRPMAD